jgi:hypothetical protein
MEYTEFRKRLHELSEINRQNLQDVKDLQKQYIEEYHLKEGDECIDEDGNVYIFKTLLFFDKWSSLYYETAYKVNEDGSHSNNDELIDGKLIKIFSL